MKAIVSGVMVMGMQSTMYPRRRRLTLAFSSARQIFSMKVGVFCRQQQHHQQHQQLQKKEFSARPD
jgi:hypothetical protein